MKVRSALWSVAVLAIALTAFTTSLGDPPAQAAGQQFTWFDQAMTHGPTKQYAQATATAPPDWTSPINYAGGRVYVRLEILTKPSAKPVAAQICIWRNSFTEETCSGTRTFTAPGVQWVDYGTPNSWWKKDGSWSWTSPFSPTRIMLKDAATGKLLLSQNCGAGCYTGTDLAEHVPITMHAEAIVVAAGSELTPPADWTGCPNGWSTACPNPGGGEPPPPPADGGVALISSGAGPAAADQPLRTRLEGLGHDVTVVDDNLVATTPLGGFDLIIISSTAQTSLIPTSLKSLAVPVLSSDAPISVKLGLGRNAGSANGTSLNIIAPTHPLAAGRSGTVAVSTSATFTALTPSSGSTIVARRVGASNTAIFAIEPGAALVSGTAPARRVGFFLGGNAPARLNANGWSLFDAAVTWALGDSPPPPPPPAGPWADADRDYRVPVILQAAPVARGATFVDVPVNLAAALTTSGGTGTPDPETIRAVEIDADGAVIDPSVATQFDQTAGSAAGVGTLVIGTETPTPSAAVRRYHVYFDVTGSGITPQTTAELVSVTSGPDAGQDSFLVDTPAGDWAYHKAGGGFSSLVDANGNDWLNYSTTPGSAGTFRGIPNMVHPAGHFHPGATTSTTTLLSSGPLKVTLRSTTADGWSTRWDIFPDRAHMQVLAAPAAFWFLYEGTPGGQNDSGDVVIRPTGTPTPLTESWTGDLPNPEYVGFADTTRDRSLVAIHHENDAGIDSYRLMEGNMTVLGFGRDGLNKTMSGTNHSFTVALIETDVTDQVRSTATGLATKFGGTIGTSERR